MSQDNQFHQYGYDHYLKAPRNQRPPSSQVKGFGSRFVRKVRGSRVAMVGLVAAVVLFVGLIALTYPSRDEEKQVPIVKADLRPIRTQPEERGGMTIPNRDSEILARAGQVPALGEREQRVENLLPPDNDDLVSKEQAIERAMSQQPAMPDDFLESGRDNVAVAPIAPKSFDDVETERFQAATAATEEAPDFSFEEEEPVADDILQKIGSSSEELAEADDSDGSVPSVFDQRVASAAVSEKPERSQLRAAATAPETLDFVRKILNEKDERVSAKDYADVEPAIGAGHSAVQITSGSYFVQLASISDPARAGQEWAKMQAQYDVLAPSKFRVQEASLARGTFYRIQAGPMSKDSADQICDALKKAGKPGGCLVVK